MLKLSGLLRDIKFDTALLYIIFPALFAGYFASVLIGYIIVKPIDVPDVSSSAPIKNVKDISVITDKNIFAIDKSAPRSETGQMVAVKAFHGKLTGVIISEKAEESRAILLINNEPYVLALGKAQDGYLLKEIDYNFAVVEYNREDYRLVVEEGVNAPTASISSGRIPVTTAPSEPVNGGTEHKTIARADIAEQLKDINELLKGIMVSPFYTDGQFLGYRVVTLQNESPVRKLGLERGDIINRINGEELTSPDILFNLLKQMSDISAVTLDVTRGGTKKTIFVEIQ